MKTTTINLKIQKDLKENAQNLAEELGFSLSSVVNASLKQFVRDGEISVSLQPKMTSYLEERIKEVQKDWKENKKGAFVAVKDSKDLDKVFGKK